jgi:hypothetical protein
VIVLAGGRVAGEARTEEIDRHWVAERVYADTARTAADTDTAGVAA